VAYNVPGASYNYSYDSMYRLGGMTTSGGTTVVNGVSYNAANQLLGMTYNGIAETRGYNVLNQLTSIVAGSTENLTYTYPAGPNNNGKISSMYNALSGETVTYTYDALNRMVGASDKNNSNVVLWAEGYTFDPFGNLTAKAVTGGTQGGPSLSVAISQVNNQIETYYYDANGNGLFGNATAYDVENHVSGGGWSNGAPVVDYGYDAQSRRFLALTAGTVDSYGNANNYLVVEYSPSGQKLGTYQISTCNDSSTNQPVLTVCSTLSTSDQYFGGRRLAVMDQLGSAGTYYPWGEAKGSTNPQDTWSFATYWRDSATGLDYADNRYYSNAYGRFMTPDPDGASARTNNPQSWNRYPYVQGDPVNSNDPTGLDGFDDGGDGVCPNIALAECGGFDPNMPGLPLPPGASYPISFPTSVTYPVNGGFGDTGSLTVNLTNGSFDFQFADTQDAAILLGACAAQPELCVVVIGGAVTIYVAATYGPALFEAVNNAIHSSNNRRQNRQFAAAVRSYERQCGQQLTQDQERALHDAITGEGLSFDQIIELAKQMFGCPGGSSN
jgi:RHS repeat-associated protein